MISLVIYKQISSNKSVGQIDVVDKADMIKSILDRSVYVVQMSSGPNKQCDCENMTG